MTWCGHQQSSTVSNYSSNNLKHMRHRVCSKVRLDMHIFDNVHSHKEINNNNNISTKVNEITPTVK